MLGATCIHEEARTKRSFGAHAQPHTPHFDVTCLVLCSAGMAILGSVRPLLHGDHHLTTLTVPVHCSHIKIQLLVANYHTNTHTLTHPHVLILIYHHAHTPSHITLTYPHIPSHTLTLYLILAHTPSLTVALISPSFPHPHTLPHTHPHTHSCPHTHPHTLTYPPKLPMISMLKHHDNTV